MGRPDTRNRQTDRPRRREDCLAPSSDNEPPASYADRLQRIQNRFAFLRFVPAHAERYTQGIGDRAVDLRDIVLVGDSREDFWSQKSFVERFVAPTLKPQNASQSGVSEDDPFAKMLSEPYRPLSQPKDDGATLHQSFDAYQSWIKEHYAE